MRYSIRDCGWNIFHHKILCLWESCRKVRYNALLTYFILKVTDEISSILSTLLIWVELDFIDYWNKYSILVVLSIFQSFQWFRDVCAACVHYNDVTMKLLTHIPGKPTVCLTVCSVSHQRKHQRFASLVFVTDGFPSQRARNAENVSIWWRHHAEPTDCSDHIIVIVFW